jgi:hypothetical protein
MVLSLAAAYYAKRLVKSFGKNETIKYLAKFIFFARSDSKIDSGRNV